MSTVFRLARAPDLVAADRVFCAAFERPGTCLPHLQLHLAIAPELFWVAEERGRIVGTAGAIDYGLIAYIGLMAVDPARQRRGIASGLLEQALAAIVERGCKIARLDATAMGAPLYERFGFVDDGTAQVWQRDSAADAIAPVGAAGVSAATRLDEIVDFDAAAFGASREKLLAALWNTHRDRCFIVRRASGELGGYLFTCDGTWGPWVAADAIAAETLLGSALRLDARRLPQVMVPRSNAAAVSLLARYGFASRRTLRHMRRGTQSEPARPSWLYGQSSFAHG